MDLFKGIEKIINEHGSATILKERISLARDEYVAVEKQNKVITAENRVLKNEISDLKTQYSKLKEQLSQQNLLTPKYGVFWDHDGTPYCPKCKTPTTNTDWITHKSSQIRGLKCSCTDQPFILMKGGEPIHAEDAMKEKANS